MPDRLFGDREKAMEEAFFRREDAKLLEKLKQNAGLDEIALAIAEKLQVDKPELLLRVRQTGLNADNASALFVAPLVQVAWANGSVTKAEHDAVLRLAHGRGIDPASAAYAQVEEWLKERPDDELFDIAVEVVKYGFAVLPEDERDARIKRVVDACEDVAEASGSSLGWVLGLKTISSSEAATLDTIAKTLRRPAR